jgi:MarR family transcriptional regulator, organic hydroperoxide resistance regulator
VDRWIREVDAVLSSLSLAFLQLERSGKCCQGLTLSQCHTLDVLSKNGNLTMNGLSRQMGLAKSTMTRIVNTMVRRGWLERRRDQEDQRWVSVRLTAEGRKMSETVTHSSREYVRRILKNLPQEKIPELVESLKWIIRSVEKEVRCSC